MGQTGQHRHRLHGSVSPSTTYEGAGVARGTPRSCERMSSAVSWRVSCSLAALCSDWSCAGVVAVAQLVNASAIAVLACVSAVTSALYLAGQQILPSPSLKVLSESAIASLGAFSQSTVWHASMTLNSRL